jgi:hypothetical protein
MTNTTDNPLANAAAAAFNSVVNTLVEKKLDQEMKLPDLGNLGITRTEDTQVAARPVGDVGKDNSLSIG